MMYDFIRSSYLDYFPFVHDAYSISKSKGFVEIVGYVDGGGLEFPVEFLGFIIF